jgi:signal transduction histidine kinase
MVQNKTMKFYPQYFIFFLILFVVSCTKKTTTTNSRNDSVEKYLKLASIDTLPIETRKKYNQKAFSFIDLEKNDSVVRWYLYKVTWNSSQIKDSIDYFLVSKSYLEKSIESKDSVNLSRSFRLKGNFYSNFTTKVDSAYYFYSMAEKMLNPNKISLDLFNVYFNKMGLLNSINDYNGANLYGFKALKQIEILNNRKLLFETLNSLGNISHNLKNYDEAIEYHKKAINHLTRYKLKNEVSSNNKFGTSLNNIGNSFREQKKYYEAITFLKKGILSENENNLDYQLRAYLYNNLGYCYLKTNNFNQLPFLLEKASILFDSLCIKDEGAISNIYLAEYYSKIKDTIKAIEYTEKAVKMAKMSKSSYNYLYTLSHAGEINRKRAPIYIKEYHRLNDSLLFEERKARNQFFKIQLETDEIAQEKEKAIKQKWVQTSVIASILLIVILLFIIFKQRSQKKEFLLIQNQQKANEEIYQLMLQQQRKEEEAKQKEKKRIALELHDNVMNKLASTRFNLFTLTQQTNSENTDNAKQHIQTIKEIEDEIRNLTHELSKEHFTEDNSFASIVTELVHQQNQMQLAKCQLQVDEAINWDTISSEIKMNLYRIIQEAIHNCNKYANATQVKINLTKENNQLQLSIKDNGIGFDVKEAKQGIGLHNMQQRIDSIRGTITIHSKPGIGTEINCNVEIKS